eukprot:scaffold90789_cov30-Tisochrysis_lutea.AAC.2
MYCWINVRTVAYFEDTSTFTGFVKEARCNFFTLDVIVAENSKVLRSRGMACKIVSSSFSKSMLRSLSACDQPVGRGISYAERCGGRRVGQTTGAEDMMVSDKTTARLNVPTTNCCAPHRARGSAHS